MLEPERHQKDWDKYLPMVTAAYRSTVHDMMMFGREVTLPKERKKESLQNSPHGPANQTPVANDAKD